MADFTFTIPDDKLATVRDAICENQGWDSYRRELQGLTDRASACGYGAKYKSTSGKSPVTQR